jgi:hypothetical protein
MKIDLRILLIVLQVSLVALELGDITVDGGWTDQNTWSGILLGFNAGAAIFGWMLYKQGNLLDEVLQAYGRSIDFTKGFLDIVEKMHKDDVAHKEKKKKATK